MVNADFAVGFEVLCATPRRHGCVPPQGTSASPSKIRDAVHVRPTTRRRPALSTWSASHQPSPLRTRMDHHPAVRPTLRSVLRHFLKRRHRHQCFIHLQTVLNSLFSTKNGLVRPVQHKKTSVGRVWCVPASTTVKCLSDQHVVLCSVGRVQGRRKEKKTRRVSTSTTKNPPNKNQRDTKHPPLAPPATLSNKPERTQNRWENRSRAAQQGLDQEALARGEAAEEGEAVARRTSAPAQSVTREFPHVSACPPARPQTRRLKFCKETLDPVSTTRSRSMDIPRFVRRLSSYSLDEDNNPASVSPTPPRAGSGLTVDTSVAKSSFRKLNSLGSMDPQWGFDDETPTPTSRQPTPTSTRSENSEHAALRRRRSNSECLLLAKNGVDLPGPCKEYISSVKQILARSEESRPQRRRSMSMRNNPALH